MPSKRRALRIRVVAVPQASLGQSHPFVPRLAGGGDQIVRPVRSAGFDDVGPEGEVANGPLLSLRPLPAQPEPGELTVCQLAAGITVALGWMGLAEVRQDTKVAVAEIPAKSVQTLRADRVRHAPAI